jgi:ComF family protein
MTAADIAAAPPAPPWWSSIAGTAPQCSAAVLGLLFPPECTFCHALLGDVPRKFALCDGCIATLLSHQPQCPFCACPTPLGAEKLPKCVRCRGMKWHVERIVALGTYENELRDAVLRTKNTAGDPLARALGRALAERVAETVSREGAAFDVVVPVPLYWLRRLEHGTNNAETVAERIAARLDLPLCADGLLRIRWTDPQSSVTGAQRPENIRGAFEINENYDWTDARVILVDDVVTTGSTINECAKVLRQAGASHVEIAALARTSGEVRLGPRPTSQR